MREDQRGEDAGRAEADDDRAGGKRFRRAGDVAVVHVGRLRDARIVGEAGEQAGLGVGAADEFEVDAVDEGERLLLARVVAALMHLQRGEGALGQIETPGGGGLERGRRMVERQAEFGDADHAGVL